MKILWFTWKDRTHPQAGGAELVNEELAKRLVADGHEVTLVVGGYKRCQQEEVIDGYRVIRLGNRYSVYWKAFRYYRRHLQGWADLVIDEVNTMPFFAKFYVKERSILFVHMLCRQIWFYELPLPLSLIGYVLEPIYMRLLNDREVITVSESTRTDLRRLGFTPGHVHIISEGIEIEPLAAPLTTTEKFAKPTILSLGAMRPMKRTLDQIKAFELAKQTIPNLQLIVAGDSSGRYGRKVLEAIGGSRFASSIRYEGRVSKADKLALMRRCHAIMVTSIKEGWGLIVTEANSQGTPAVVYNVDGLRDSVRHGETGLIAERRTPLALAQLIIELVDKEEQYPELSEAALEWSKEITFDQSYAGFYERIGK